MKTNGLHQRAISHIIRPDAAFRMVAIAAGLTVIATLFSLAELSRLIGQANPGSQRLNWKEVAGRAVKHAEHLPHLHGLHRQSGRAADMASLREQ
jgi:hypothetical protein